jgi:hypothetical protein
MRKRALLQFCSHIAVIENQDKTGKQFDGRRFEKASFT